MTLNARRQGNAPAGYLHFRSRQIADQWQCDFERHGGHAGFHIKHRQQLCQGDPQRWRHRYSIGTDLGTDQGPGVLWRPANAGRYSISTQRRFPTDDRRGHLCAQGFGAICRRDQTSNACTQLVSDTITFTGNAFFKIGCSNATEAIGSTQATPGTPGIPETVMLIE